MYLKLLVITYSIKKDFKLKGNFTIEKIYGPMEEYKIYYNDNYVCLICDYIYPYDTKEIKNVLIERLLPILNIKYLTKLTELT